MSRTTIAAGIVLALLVLSLIVLVVVSTHTQAQFDPEPKAIGSSTPVKLKIANPHGVRQVRAFVEQDGVRTQVFETSQPSTRLTFFRKHEAPRGIEFMASGKKEGKARLIAEVKSNDFWGA